MKALLSLVFILSLGFVYSQDQWITVDSLKGKARSVAASCVIYNEGYAFGGLDEDGFRRKVHTYNYLQNDWDERPAIGGDNGGGLNRGSACAFELNNLGYVCLGQGVTNPFFKDLWQYDPGTGVWEQKADFLGSERRQAIAIGFDSIAIVGTGVDATGFRKDMYKYSQSTNTWTQISDFAGTARKEAVGFRMAGYGYVGTGDDGVMKNDFWQYNPLTDMWEQKANLPATPRRGAVGWGTFPQAFICAGEDIGFNYMNDVWEYNYYGNTWVQRASLPGPGRSNAIAFVIEGYGFVGSGYNGVFLDDFYSYQKVVGLDEHEPLEAVVFPNPSSDIINVQIDPTDVELRIFAIDGKEVTGEFSVQTSSNGFVIGRNTISAGNYILQLNHQVDGRSYQGKIALL